MTIKRFMIGACTLLALTGCGAGGSIDQQMNEAAATVASRVGGLAETADALSNDPTAQAMASSVAATIEAAANDPTAQALIDEGMATAEAAANDPTAQAMAATALANANDPTAQAMAASVLANANDPTAQAMAATALAAATDPTAQALAATALANANPNDVQAALDEAFKAANEEITLVEGQDLTLPSLSDITDITNYRMTVVNAPAGAEASEGQVIKEASDGNVSLTPEEYGKYFTVAGDYTVRLDITSNGQTASNEFTVTVP